MTNFTQQMKDALVVDSLCLFRILPRSTGPLGLALLYRVATAGEQRMHCATHAFSNVNCCYTCEHPTVTSATLEPRSMLTPWRRATGDEPRATWVL